MTTGWEHLKQMGSDHYKGGGVEPIDLFRAGDTFQDFAVSSIIKYAYRNRRALAGTNISEKDMTKIIHYARLLIVCHQEQKTPDFEIIGKKAE